MKKLIAIVLSVAMMLTVCAFSVSAEDATPTLLIEGPTNALVGNQYVVNVRLSDADNEVGGFQGEIAYSGATVVDAQVNPQVLDYNNTKDGATVINKDAEVIKFATVTDLDGVNPATRIWFKVTFEITGEASFTLQNIIYSDKEANEIDGAEGNTITPVLPEAGEPTVSLDAFSILTEVAPMDQGIVIDATLNENTAVDAYGVVFYPTSLLKGEALEVDTAGAAVAILETGDKNFEEAKKDGGKFNAVLRFGFSTEENAAKFLGTKVSARAFCKVGDNVYYSSNNVDEFIVGGVADKAVLNTVLANGDAFAEAGATGSNITVEQYNTAKGKINTNKYPDEWFASRKTVLEFVVDNFLAK